MNEKNFEKQIAKLTQQIEQQNSLQKNFLVGIFRGLGTALGATVVFGLVLAGVFHMIRSIDYVPLLNTILSSEAVEELIRRFTQPSL